jgi:hypothetical protein
MVPLIRVAAGLLLQDPCVGLGGAADDFVPVLETAFTVQGVLTRMR